MGLETENTISPLRDGWRRCTRRDDMCCHRWALGSLLFLTAVAGVCRAEDPPRLRASWKEREARVEAFSPDGRCLVSSGAEGYRLRDTETGQVRAVLTT